MEMTETLKGVLDEPDAKAEIAATPNQIMMLFGAMSLDDTPMVHGFDFEMRENYEWSALQHGLALAHQHTVDRLLPSKRKKNLIGADQLNTRTHKKAKLKRRPTQFESSRPVHINISTPALANTPPTPPPQLLSLPAEVRNAIWSIFAAYDEPVIAQLRQILACKRGLGPSSQTVRRFPLEPHLASVNRQVRKELLSIYYGVNTFIFDSKILKPYLGRSPNMPSPLWIQQWRPPRSLATFLNKVDLVLNAKLGHEAMTVTFQLRKVSTVGDNDEKVVVHVTAQLNQRSKKEQAATPAYCLCHQQKVIEKTLAVIKDADVTETAIELIRQSEATRFILSAAEETYSAAKDDNCTTCRRALFKMVAAMF